MALKRSLSAASAVSRNSSPVDQRKPPHEAIDIAIGAVTIADSDAAVAI